MIEVASAVNGTLCGPPYMLQPLTDAAPVPALSAGTGAAASAGKHHHVISVYKHHHAISVLYEYGIYKYV